MVTCLIPNQTLAVRFRLASDVLHASLSGLRMCSAVSGDSAASSEADGAFTSPTDDGNHVIDFLPMKTPNAL